MRFVSDPAIATKICKMHDRVRWNQPALVQLGIDQTRFVLDDGQNDTTDFSVLVIGDSGTGRYRTDDPQRRVAELMLTHGQDCRFTLHTGDVVYMVGSSEQYPENFIQPYREWLVGGDQPDRISYDRMVFQRPLLPVPGNHDYYDLPFVWGALAQAAFPIRRLLQARFDLDLGWHGSFTGDAYARAFLDYLQAMDGATLSNHLDQHYTAQTESGRCLRYQPGSFTRLPNRYYSFRYGGIDFFALDSNTFNQPLPIPFSQKGDDRRRELETHRSELERQRNQLMEQAVQTIPGKGEVGEQFDDLYAEAEQLDEQIRDIDKQLKAPEATITVDTEQLNWLQQRLIESWNTPAVRGRILYFHHPPYVTESTKWHQGQTLAIRYHLRQVLDAVRAAVQSIAEERPLVDLVINGHAHCLEYLTTVDTGHGDANLNWLICGGSGFSLRRQRSQGPELMESLNGAIEPRPIAYCHQFIGRSGHGSLRRRSYSCVRIDVGGGDLPQITLRPLVAEKFQRQWQTYESEAIVLKNQDIAQ